MSVAGSGAGSAVGGAAEGWSGSSPAATVDFVTRSWEVSVSVAGSGAGSAVGGAAEGWSGSSFAADVDFGAVEAGVVTGSAVGVAVVVGCGSAPVARSGSCAATTAVVPDGAAGPRRGPVTVSTSRQGRCQYGHQNKRPGRPAGDCPREREGAVGVHLRRLDSVLIASRLPRYSYQRNRLRSLQIHSRNRASRLRRILIGTRSMAASLIGSRHLLSAYQSRDCLCVLCVYR